MELISTPMEGLWVIKPTVFQDDRGYFYESWSRNSFNKAGLLTDFVQDNQSLSQKHVIRGLHFQNPPFAQAKLVRVIQGAVWDVAVDIRKNSASFGEAFSIELNEANKLMLYIPEGFAHGFETLENQTIFSYKCSNIYNKASEDSIMWNDPDLAIRWNTAHPVLSQKDMVSKPFKSLASLF
jgi:dTDP-4-dehydrorhamnose 3,5-epimerase